MSLRAAVLLCQEEILRDLGAIRDISELLRLPARYSLLCLPDPLTQSAKWDGDAIYLSPHLSLPEIYEAITHEVVHALADTERWAHLNYYIEGWRYDRGLFIETLACRVGETYRNRLSLYPQDCQ